MEVVDHDPQAWFLLKADDGYYLSVRCQNSFVEFETLLALTPDEYREYHALGHVYIAYLAARVSYWSNEYTARNVNKDRGADVTRAVLRWKGTTATTLDTNTLT